MAPVSQRLGPCPRCCGFNEETGQGRPCGMVGTKLTRASGGKCVKGCRGPSCLGRRKQKKGRRGQHNAHRTLGGAGFSPFHEESGKTYSVEVQVESKAGAQIPANLMSFARSEWARRAWSQAERAVPAGVVAFPSIYAERDGWQLLVVRLKEGRR